MNKLIIVVAAMIAAMVPAKADRAKQLEGLANMAVYTTLCNKLTGPAYEFMTEVSKDFWQEGTDLRLDERRAFAARLDKERRRS